MLIIGLTGGIGSGKTTVANLFVNYQVPVIDADAIARELTTNNPTIIEAIFQHFGPEIFTATKQLNRRQLRDIIFNDTNARRWLENLLHPWIYKIILDQLKDLTSAYCIIVIPLLIESDFTFDFINRILLIDAREEDQINRVCTRDKIAPDLVQKIIASQAQQSARYAKAHDIIINHGDITHLLPQVQKLHSQYLSLAKHYKK